MPNGILVVNAGSTSLKLSYVQIVSGTADGQELVRRWSGQVNWNAPAQASVELPNGRKQSFVLEDNSFADALRRLLDMGKQITDSGVKQAVDAVGHRVVHGGEKYQASALIDKQVKADLAGLVELAPAHERANIEGITVASDLFENAAQVAVFDTAFHQSMSRAEYLYPVPYEWYHDFGIRRYGFHGISHSYCAGRAAAMLGRSVKSLKIITCHLGGGASLAAIEGGVSRMTTMGYTPLDGLMMSTRSGSVDPGVVLHLLHHKKYDDQELLAALNGASGLKGISGISGDMKEIQIAALEGNERAQLAFDMYVLSLRKHIGSMLGVLGGLDALVFTGGVGENSAAVRALACEPFAFAGLLVDEVKNATCQPDMNISADNARVATLVVHAQEDLAIARECLQLLPLH